jgi:hypothetical protein
LVVTLSIVAILGALLLSATTRSREKARAAKCQETLHQVYVATVMYADDHDGHVPRRSFFVEEKTTPPLCPSAREEKNASAAYGGYAWDIPYLGDTRMEGITPSNWLVQDMIPWHDPGRRFAEGLGWSGRYNMLWGDGRIEWKFENRKPSTVPHRTSVLQATAGLRCGFRSSASGPPRLSTIVRPHYAL